MIKKNIDHTPQKKVWESIKVLDTYEDAKRLSDSLDKETKIRRCGKGGPRYKSEQRIRTYEFWRFAILVKTNQV